MEWATFQAVVDGLEPDATVAFVGLGEPLLHPRFLDMVRLAKASGLRAEVTTNALLLDNPTAAGLLDAGLDQLVVSIDGANAEAFDRVRAPRLAGDDDPAVRGPGRRDGAVHADEL